MNVNLKLPHSPHKFRDIADAEAYCAQLQGDTERLIIMLGRILTNLDEANITEIPVSKVSGITTDAVSGLEEYITERINARANELEAELKKYINELTIDN